MGNLAKPMMSKAAQERAYVPVAEIESMPLEMPDSVAIACSCLVREAKLSARVGDQDTREVFLKIAVALKDPARVAAFLDGVVVA